MPKELSKLQEAQYRTWEKSLSAVQRIELARFRAAYDSSILKIAKLYQSIGLESPINGQYILKSEAIKYGRLDNLEKAVIAEIAGLKTPGIRATQAFAGQSMADGYYGAAWSYDQAIGAQLRLRDLPAAVIKDTITSNEGGLGIPDQWGKVTIEQSYNVRGSLVRGISQGDSFTAVSRAVKDQFDRGFTKAAGIIETRGGNAYFAGHIHAQSAAEAKGLNVKRQWHHASYQSQHLRSAHIALDGTFPDKNGLFWSNGFSAPAPRMFGEPSEDYNCRCSVYDVIETVSGKLAPANADEVLPPRSFEQWARPKGWTPEKGWPKELLKT